MPLAHSVMYEEQYQELNGILSRLRTEANAKAAFLIDKAGQQMAAAGENLEMYDATSLASLTAGNVASTDAIAQLIGERAFSALVHEGEKDSLHISLVNDRIILVVLFDERSSLGLVRLRVRQASPSLVDVFSLMERLHADRSAQAENSDSPFAEITDADIDGLFA